MNLTIRRRSALVVAIVTALALGVLLAFDRLVLVSSFQEFEDSEVRGDVTRVIRGVDAECRRLEVLISDWAQWDDSYEFMRTRSRAFVVSNLSSNILDDLDLAAMVFIDLDGNVVEVAHHAAGGEVGADRGARRRDGRDPARRRPPDRRRPGSSRWRDPHGAWSAVAARGAPDHAQ